MAQLNVGGNFLAGLSGGLEAGQNIRQMQDQNALRSILEESGGNLMDPNVMAQVTALNPTMGMQLQNQAYQREQDQFQRTRQQAADARAEKLFEIQLAEYAAGLSEQERAREARLIEQGLMQATQLYRAGDLQGLNMMLAEVGEQPISSLDQFEPIAAKYKTVWDTLQRTAPASPEFGFSNGQFYDKNNPAAGAQDIPNFREKNDGLSITLPDGTIVAQGNQPVSVGKTKPGFEQVLDPATGRLVERAIPGGPEDTTTQDIARRGAQETIGDVVLNAAIRAKEANSDRLLTGLAGQVASVNPANENAELNRQIEVLRSNATIESLNAMRQQSPTGGALGNVTEGEGRMLAARAGALDPASPNFERDLADYTRALLRTIHGPDEGDRLFDLAWQDQRLPTREERRSRPDQRGEDIGGGTTGGIPVIDSDAAYDELLPGQVFRDPDGKLRRKPAQ